MDLVLNNLQTLICHKTQTNIQNEQDLLGTAEEGWTNS